MMAGAWTFLVKLVFGLAVVCLMLRVVLSWLPAGRRTPLYRWLFPITEPMLRPFRALVFRPGMRFDLSPLAAVIALELLRWLLLAIV